MGWSLPQRRTPAGPPVRPCWCCHSPVPSSPVPLCFLRRASPKRCCVWEGPCGLCPQGEALARRTLLCWEGVYAQTWGLLAQGLGDFSLVSQDSLFSLFFWETSARLETSLLQLVFTTDFIFSIAFLLLEAEASWPEPFLAADAFSPTASVAFPAPQLLLRLLSAIVRCPREGPASLPGEQPAGGASTSSFPPWGLQRVQV